MPNRPFPPLFNAAKPEQLVLLSYLTEYPAFFEFIVSSMSDGITPELTEYAYSQGLMPWPTADLSRLDIYPWGRTYPMTVLRTEALPPLHKSLRKVLANALARHYRGATLEILLDEDYEGFLDRVADYHTQTAGTTWLTQNMRETWKALHAQNKTHVITVKENGTLIGGLCFTTLGRMLYGETAMSTRPEASRLALIALVALAHHNGMPWIDCQQHSSLIEPLGPESCSWEDYLPLHESLVRAPSPDWDALKGDLIPLMQTYFDGIVKPHPYQAKKPKTTVSSREATSYASIDAEIDRLHTQLEQALANRTMTSTDAENEPLETIEVPEDVPTDDAPTDRTKSPPKILARKLNRFDQHVYPAALVEVGCSYFKTRKCLMDITFIRSDQRPSMHDENSHTAGRLSDLGLRREASYMVRLCCQGCSACIPVRVLAQNFKPNARFRRVLNKNKGLQVEVFPMPEKLNAEQFALYQRYFRERHTDSHMGSFTPEDINHIFFRRYTRASLMEIRRPRAEGERGELVMVCIMDEYDDSVSAVYNFFDPALEPNSIGTFGILAEIEYTRLSQRSYLYLGYWLQDFPGMDYKRHFKPLEVFRNQTWEPLETYLARHPSAEPFNTKEDL